MNNGQKAAPMYKIHILFSDFIYEFTIVQSCSRPIVMPRAQDYTHLKARRTPA